MSPQTETIERRREASDFAFRHFLGDIFAVPADQRGKALEMLDSAERYEARPRTGSAR